MKPDEKVFQSSMSIYEEIIDEIENVKTFIFFDFECTQDDMLKCE